MRGVDWSEVERRKVKRSEVGWRWVEGRQGGYAKMKRDKAKESEAEQIRVKSSKMRHIR